MTESENSPESLAEQGKSAYQIGDFKSADHFFHEAERLFTRAGNMLMAAEMANNRSVVLLISGNAKAALEASKDTQLVFAEAGDHLREGLAYGNQAAALKDLGNKDESLKMYHLSAEKLNLAGDRENLALVQKSISTLEVESGHALSAISAMLDSLKDKEHLTLKEKIIRKLFTMASRFMN